MPKRIFMHGIAGTGMRGLALLLTKQGHTIIGTDSVIPPELATQYKLQPEEAATSLLEGADEYIHTDSVLPENPLRLKVAELQIPTYAYQEAVGRFAADYSVVAVTGTHGKSSTTAFLAHILTEADLSPSALVGAGVTNWNGEHARFGNGDLFVVEADEYRDHFLSLSPDMILIPSLEYDHPDFFETPDRMFQSYQAFLKKLKPNGHIIIPQSVFDTMPIDWPANVIVIEDYAMADAPLPGEHMRLNAALAVRGAQLLGVEPERAVELLQTFSGLSRRTEVLGTLGDAVVLSDYAHHPTEIAATITALRERYTKSRIAVLFEAHMLERLVTFKKDYVKALTMADTIALYPVFLPTGRRSEYAQEAQSHLDDLNNTLLAQQAHVVIIPGPAELPAIVSDLATTNNLVVGLTAGNLDRELRSIVNAG